jgi:hypothetical protein
MERVASFVDQVSRSENPEYDPYKEEKQNCRILEMVSVAGIVGTVALAIIGFSLATSSGIVAFIGVDLLIACLPIGYAAYNLYTISKNMLEIANNHGAYRIVGVGSFDRQRLKDRLEAGTFFCDWAVDAITDSMIRKDGL